MTRYARIVADHATTTVLTVVMLMSFLACCGTVDPRIGNLRLIIDPRIEQLVLRDDVKLRFYKHALALCGSDEYLVIELSDTSIF